ncbi:hypothetical protein BN133_245 [Cronobacter dublinensis 582]|nr:hypothetical protein BN133_245 [Cronobacter dublinensis 582]
MLKRKKSGYCRKRRGKYKKKPGGEARKTDTIEKTGMRVNPW